MKDFYQVQIDHGDYWSESTDVLAVSPQRAAYEYLKGLAEEDWDWCSVEWHNIRVRKGGGEWEGYRMRARIKVVVEDYADKPNATSEGPPPSRPESKQEASGGSLH